MFSSKRNKDIIKSNIVRNCAQPLNDQHLQRLDKTINHYMKEVWTAQNSQPISFLNREVHQISQNDFTNYLRSSTNAIKKPSVTRSALPAQQQPTIMSTPIDALEVVPSMMQDTGRSLEQLQKERQGAQPQRPPIPEFRISSESEDGPSPLELYEMAKLAREKEAATATQQGPPTAPVAPAAQASVFPQPNDVFRTILGPDVHVPTGVAPLPPPIKTRNRETDEMSPRVANPMLLDEPRQPSGKQNILIRQDDIQQYKEIEQNLFVNSLDRDWTKDNVLSMNRYNFTVNFDPSAASQNQNLVPFAQKKFKNIVRVQLIKAIISRETLDVLLTKTDVSTYATTAQTNVLSFPSVNIRISELDGNNYGTNPRIDDSFGLVHYDAQWVSDPAGAAVVPSSGLTTNNGYVSLVPKFLSCERVYEPTPLATLQKLSIRLERPTSASLLSDVSDVVTVADIYLSSGTDTSIYRGTFAATGISPYIFIKTSKYFSKFMWEQGDRVIFRGVNATLSGASAATQTSVNYIEEWINREEGHIIVGIGNSADTTVNISVNDGANTVGYANYIIIQSRFTDPAATGSTSPYNFGNESDINTAFEGATAYTGSGINASHQVQLVFKIVTREYDPATKLRPDNL